MGNYLKEVLSSYCFVEFNFIEMCKYIVLFFFEILSFLNLMKCKDIFFFNFREFLWMSMFLGWDFGYKWRDMVGKVWDNILIKLYVKVVVVEVIGKS